MCTRIAQLIAAAAAFVLALTGCGERSTGTEPKAPSSSGEPAALFLAGDGEMWIVDAEVEEAKHLRIPELGAGDPPRRIATVGDRLALWDGRRCQRSGSRSLGGPRDARERRLDLHPGGQSRSDLGRFLDPASPATVRGLSELREIDAAGHVITGGVKPPDGAWPYAELSGGLLFQGPGPIRLWEPDTERTIRTYRWKEIGDMGPVSGDLLASCVEDCEQLILTNFASGEQRRIGAPEGLAFVAFEAAFSPNGATLAVPVIDADGGWRSFSTYDRQLALVEIEDETTEIVVGPEVPPGYVFTAWSPDGSQVFMTGGGPETARVITAYRPGDEVARILDVEVGNFYDIAAGPARP